MGQMDQPPDDKVRPTEKGTALYHRIYAHEDFDEAATALLELVHYTEQKLPGKPRFLYLDIDGHRNEEGGYDRDMFELQKDFLLDFLMPCLTECSAPLVGKVRNNSTQRNDVPERLEIRPASNGDHDGSDSP